MRLFGQALANIVHIGLQARVSKRRVFLHDLGMALRSDLNLLLLAHDRALLLASDGVNSFGTTADQGSGERGADEPAGDSFHGFKTLLRTQKLLCF